jgi:hypothetical protein
MTLSGGFSALPTAASGSTIALHVSSLTIRHAPDYPTSRSEQRAEALYLLICRSGLPQKTAKFTTKGSRLADAQQSLPTCSVACKVGLYSCTLFRSSSLNKYTVADSFLNKNGAWMALHSF